MNPQLVAEAEKALQRQWDSWEDPIDRDEDPLEVFCGNIEYRLPGGWKIIVFIDCNDWDYIDHIVAPDGTILDPDHVKAPDDRSAWHPLFFWSPKEEDPRWGKFG